MLFEQFNRAVNGNEVDFGVQLFCPIEDLVHIEVLFGVVHDLEDGLTLPGHADPQLAHGLLQRPGGFRRIEPFADRNPVRRDCVHFFLPGGSPEREDTSGMKWKPPQNVMIHNNGEEDQKEDEANLNVAFFERHTQVAPQASFNRQEQNVSAIENRDGQEIENTKIDADQNHQRDDSQGTAVHGALRLVTNPHRPLQLADRNPAGEELSDHIHRAAHRVPREVVGDAQTLAETHATIGCLLAPHDPNLIDAFPIIIEAHLRGDGRVNYLAFAQNIEGYWLAV